jgi:hypothetical protein
VLLAKLGLLGSSAAGCFKRCCGGGAAGGDGKPGDKTGDEHAATGTAAAAASDAGHAYMVPPLLPPMLPDAASSMPASPVARAPAALHVEDVGAPAAADSSREPHAGAHTDAASNMAMQGTVRRSWLQQGRDGLARMAQNPLFSQRRVETR